MAARICANCGLTYHPGVDTLSEICDECQGKLLNEDEAKDHNGWLASLATNGVDPADHLDESAFRSINPQDVILGGSDKAVQSMVTSVVKGKEPDFTVTAATFREGGPTYFTLAWETVSAGFGELTFYRHEGKLKVDTEGMGGDFCREVFEKLIEQALPKKKREPVPSLKPQPYGNYEGHDLRRADMDIVWSVGATPEDAIQALCEARWGGTLEQMGEALEGGDKLFTWGYRFLSDNGTSFKAAGVHIPGGVALTWWK